MDVDPQKIELARLKYYNWYLKDIIDDILSGYTTDYYLRTKYSDIDELETSIEIQFQNHLKDLNSEHCGDCTNVPMTCARCYIEELLGI